MILLLTDPTAGGTFLSWSLHYLAGHIKYFSVKNNAWNELIDNPLTNINAHNFKPNQPTTISEIYTFLKNLQNIKSNDFHLMYFHNLSDQVDYSASPHLPTVEAIHNILPNFSKIIILNNQNALYHVSLQSRSLTKKFTNPAERNLSDWDQHTDFVNYFFGKSHMSWVEKKLTDVWDYREFLALNIRPNKQVKINSNFDLTHPHYLLDTVELYTSLNQTVGQLFDFLDIKIDYIRLNHWIKIYKQWQEIHTKRLQFIWYFDTIINYIINGYNMDLLRFNLDLLQEACIQHYLIYNHNLNLKTWQLEKFINTKQLYNLLEPNTHTLTTY